MILDDPWAVPRPHFEVRAARRRRQVLGDALIVLVILAAASWLAMCVWIVTAETLARGRCPPVKNWNRLTVAIPLDIGAQCVYGAKK